MGLTFLYKAILLNNEAEYKGNSSLKKKTKPLHPLQKSSLMIL